METHPEPPFVVVGIGVGPESHGSLVELLNRTVIDGLAFVVVGKLPGGDLDAFVTRLRGDTSFDVVAVTHGLKVEPKRVYVCPPGVGAHVEDGAFVLQTGEGGARAQLTIDTCLRTLGRSYGSSAAGVLLKGSRPDGSAGLAAIRAEGGITYSEDPTAGSALHLPSGEADFTLPAGEIGAELVHLAHQRGVGGLNKSGIKEASQEELQRVFGIIKSGFGLDLSLYKLNTILRRLERRMALSKHERISDYLKLLQSNANERQALSKDLLIRVTSFFRDDAPFTALRETVFPRIFECKRPGSAVRIWSAGCATGEETYSLAMTLFEFLGERAADYKIQLFGTDVDGDSIHFARRALYPPNIALDVSPERLRRFFVQREGDYQVSRRLRDSVVFAEHNLTKDAPFSRIDLVCCRNVLIYLQAPAQKRVFRTLHYALNPEGVLVLGNSETVGDSELFAVLDKRTRVYLKRNVAPVANFELSAVSPGGLSSAPTDAPRPPVTPAAGPSIQQMAERKILERYGPPGVLVNENLEVLHFRGRTGPYLDPMPGHATLNILKLARPELQMTLRSLLSQVFSENRPISSEVLRLRGATEADAMEVRLELIPIQDPDGRSCALILFEEGPRSPRAEATLPPSVSEPSPNRVSELERELSSMREHLQRTIEELETSNEELKSSNEELQSSNEELQSTNEELETSKEELQSTNEELTTVNDELQERMIELSTVNDDLQNLLSSVESATLLVDLDCRIRHYSRAAERLLDLVPADVGRSLSQVRDFLNGLEVETICHDTVKHVTPWEGAALARNGRRYLLRVVPYQTADHAIRGVVIVLSELSLGAGDQNQHDA